MRKPQTFFYAETWLFIVCGKMESEKLKVRNVFQREKRALS